MTAANPEEVKLETIVLDGSYCLRFFYYMYGADTDDLKVTVHNIYNSSDIKEYFSHRKTQGDRWKEALFSILTTNKMKSYRFELTQHNSWRRGWNILEILLDKALPENCSSAKLYQLLKNLLAPDIPSDQTLDKLKDALKKHLTPKPLIIPSRHKFLNRKQTEGEGEINNSEAKLKLRHGVKPIFCRVRTVPFALKGRVENEIDRLEKEGIIEKVDSSEWATPVVPVVKSDGSIRLYVLIIQ
ncbi:retrovirus-related Pol polyprotein from transposon 412 [Trichonephila clavipes]|uniref:Retrovirus-related Pol polyprotein from transposon 412 n=1 Tax=Trichonephila clavipes TaxID=2585209 RepID=A0A8X6SUL1_TRICX|nr:retrovirus-related Pol polyprotein from transposon 412 [Trichonephila clavipes]